MASDFRAHTRRHQIDYVATIGVFRFPSPEVEDRGPRVVAADDAADFAIVLAVIDGGDRETDRHLSIN